MSARGVLQRTRLTRIAHYCRDSEVGQFQSTFAVEHHVGRLEVAMK